MKATHEQPAGGLLLLDEERLGTIPLFYCRGKWYGPTAGGFAKYSDGHAAVLLSEYGISRTIRNTTGTTPADRALLWLMQNRHVSYAGPLAGYPVGCHEMGSQRVLVTEALTLPETWPKAWPKGTPEDWPTIREIVVSLLDDFEHEQADAFFIWCAASFKELQARLKGGKVPVGERPFRHCPALAIIGERGCGKSALIDLVLKPLFGGREADPLNFLREGKFNADLFPAALLKLDDKGASANLEERRQRGDALKALIWQEFQRMEGKGLDAVMVAPFWRLVIAANPEDSSLNVLPTLNDSLRDKLILLRAKPAENLPADDAAKAAWVKAIRAELPAFALWLTKYKPRRGLKLDARTGVLNLWHPEVAGALLEKQPECKAREVIAELFPMPWEGTATEFYKEVRQRDGAGHFEGLFASIDKCGRMLTELARTVPAGFGKTLKDGVSRYRIGAAKE